MPDQHDFFIYPGDAVKAMPGGVVGGYVVQFGTEATKDSQGEWFTSDTDFDTEFPSRASVFYNHGMDPAVGKRRLTYGSIKRDETGLWVEAQLDLRDRYQAAMYGMAKAGKLGWSSGAVAHFTDPGRDEPGGAIKSWPGISHDCSLTPIPADRRNLAIALKSWEPPPLEELAGDGAASGFRPVSLNEATERAIDTLEVLIGDYHAHAVKAGRKQFTGARIERLTRVRELIDALLSETAPRDGDDEEESAPAPVMGQGTEAGLPARAIPVPTLPDLHDLYTSLCQQADGGLSTGSIL